MITSDSLNFHNIPDSDFEGLEVERLEDGPSGNRGYLPISVEDVVILEDTAENRDRRDYIVECIKQKGLSRPDRNLNRNI